MICLCRFSGSRFHHESQMIKARFWREGKLKKAPGGLRNFISQLPSPRTPTIAYLQTYIREVTTRLGDLLNHYGSVGHRRWRKQVLSLPPLNSCMYYISKA